MKDYDAGLLNDYGGGRIGWWWDYIRAEIGRANDFWREQSDAEIERLSSEIDRLNALLSTANNKLLTAQLKEVKLTIEIGRLEQLLNPKPKEENDA